MKGDSMITTKHIAWNEKNGFREEDLLEANSIIQAGGLIAFPTETVYGLGGDGLRDDVTKKIYIAKGRPSDNPLILHISNEKCLPTYVKEISKEASILIDTFWPGPLTLIFEKKDCVPYTTTGGLNTVAIRIPNHSGAKDFLDFVNIPIAAPSANVSGRPSPTDVTHVIEDLDGKIDMIIDGGNVGIGIESTIVDVSGDIPTILRPGFISKKMLEEAIGKVEIDPSIDKDFTDSFVEKPKAPGMKYRHYAPKAEMIIIDGDKEKVVKKINNLVSKSSKEEVGILATEETKDRYPKGCVVCMGSRNKKTLARELYRAIRKFDHLGVSRIYAEGFSGEPDTEAIMNRLKKAAGYNIITL